jgi:hypothetical protein
VQDQQIAALSQQVNSLRSRPMSSARSAGNIMTSTASGFAAGKMSFPYGDMTAGKMTGGRLPTPQQNQPRLRTAGCGRDGYVTAIW